MRRGRGGGGGGWTFKNVFEALFPRLWKRKNAGTFFHRKGISMPNLSGFWATWKIAMKSSYRAGLHGALQFYSELCSVSDGLESSLKWYPLSWHIPLCSSAVALGPLMWAVQFIACIISSQLSFDIQAEIIWWYGKIVNIIDSQESMHIIKVVECTVHPPFIFLNAFCLSWSSEQKDPHFYYPGGSCPVYRQGPCGCWVPQFLSPSKCFPWLYL